MWVVPRDDTLPRNDWIGEEFKGASKSGRSRRILESIIGAMHKM